MTTSRTTWVVLLLVPFAMSAILVLSNPVSHVAAGEYNGATDFDYFYSGAELFAQGRYEELYDPEVFPQLLDRTEPKLWYAYSPMYARAWGPLTRFSIDSAWVIWTLLSAVLIALAAALNAAKWRATAAILAIASFPAAMNLQLGQNAAVSAVLIGIAHAMIIRGRPIGAGLALGLMFKPQLAIGVGLCWQRRTS